METSSQLLLSFLLNACWQLALIAAVASFCDWLLRETAARYRHWLWVAALVLSLGLPVLTGWRAFEGKLSGKQSLPPAAAKQVDVVPISSAQEVTQDTVTLLPAPVLPKTTSAFISINRTWAAILITLYFLILCYRSIKLLAAWRRTRAITRNADEVDLLEQLQTTIQHCQKAIGITRVGIRSSTSILVPVTVGNLKPLVILPEYLLREADANVLTSAIGHELVHISRRDYLLNLIYELIYLPLSFHPATVLVRRRINQTRELGCDELVTEKLLDAEVYARSLVQLASAAIPLRGHTNTITVGIADADILEERVMTMLKRSKTNVGRKSWLLIAAALCLAVPCVAAAPFALRININSQVAAVTPQQDSAQEGRQKGEQARAEVVVPTIGANMETGTLASWLKKPGDTVERGEAIAMVTTDKGWIKAEAHTSGVIEKLLVQPGKKVRGGDVLAVIRAQEPSVGLAVSTAQQEERERKAEHEAKAEFQGLVYMVQLRDGQEARTMTLQREPSQEARERNERIEQMVKETIEKNPALDARAVRAEIEKMMNAARMEERAREEREAQNPELIAHRRAEREAMAKRQAELVKEARITMQQAIQIATSQYPGTVLESRLVREGPLHQASYILAILFDNGAETTTTRVLMSAIDGSITSAFKQER